MDNSLKKTKILNHLRNYLSNIQCGYFIANEEEVYIYEEAYNAKSLLIKIDSLIDKLNENLAQNKLSLNEAYSVIDEELENHYVQFGSNYDFENYYIYHDKQETLKERNFSLYDILPC